MYNVSCGIKCLLYREWRNRIVTKNVACFHESTVQKLMRFLLGFRIAGGNCVRGELRYKLNYEA